MNCPSEGLCRSVNCLEIKWWTAQWTVRKYFSFLILRTNWYPIWWSQFMKPKTETCTGYVINMELTWGNEAVWKRRKKTFLQAQSVLKTTAYFYSDLTFLKMFQLVKFYRVFFFFLTTSWSLRAFSSPIRDQTQAPGSESAESNQWTTKVKWSRSVMSDSLQPCGL